MPPKKSKADIDVDSLFADVDDLAAAPPRKPTVVAGRKDGSIRKKKPDDEENALLAELEGLTAEHRAPSRPVTPRIPRSSVDSVRKSIETRNSGEVARPAPKATTEQEEESDDDDDEDEDDEDDDDDEEEEAEEQELEKKGAARLPLQHQEKREASPPARQQEQSGGGWGWSGSLWSTASAALTVAQSTASAAANTAQGVYKEIQASEEGKKWTEQVKGNAEFLKGLGGELQKRAIPTFTTLLQHIAPPISSHERLHIHTAHDLVSYPSIDPIIYSVFSRVMQQVDGGELMVVQRGAESTKKRDVDGVGWGGGPWWRDERKRDLSACFGLEEGVKLVRVTAETYATEYLSKKDEVESADGVIRKSDIFLAIQPTTYQTPSFYEPTATAPSSPTIEGVVEPKDEPESLTVFAIYLTDPMHQLKFTTVSQAFPAKWGEWMDARFEDLPEDMQMGLANGAVDPREWIAEWMEETLALGVGLVAQRYVSRRMGVGEGLGKGKERAVPSISEKAGGEEARAI